MSTIVAQTLSNGTVSTSTANCIQGSAKAWVQFVGSSGAISGSYNVSSITKNSTGNFTINFTNAFANNQYSFALSAMDGGTASVYQLVGYQAIPSTTQFRCYSYNFVGSIVDVPYNSAVFFR